MKFFNKSSVKDCKSDKNLHMADILVWRPTEKPFDFFQRHGDPLIQNHIAQEFHFIEVEYPFI